MEAVTTERGAAKYKSVHMADNEWSNHDHFQIMPRIARETLEAEPDLDFVEVVEHGGWWLSFNRAGHVVASANDRAKYPDSVREWWGQFKGMEYTGSIRRGEEN